MTSIEFPTKRRRKENKWRKTTKSSSSNSGSNSNKKKMNHIKSNVKYNRFHTKFLNLWIHVEFIEVRSLSSSYFFLLLLLLLWMQPSISLFAPFCSFPNPFTLIFHQQIIIAQLNFQSTSKIPKNSHFSYAK